PRARRGAPAGRQRRVLHRARLQRGPHDPCRDPQLPDVCSPERQRDDPDPPGRHREGHAPLDRGEQGVLRRERAGMTPPPGAPKRVGVRVAGTGSLLPSKRLANADLEKLMDTTDEWIVQRTGIRERRLVGEGESVSTMGAGALRKALAAARLAPTDLDLIICATMTGEMPCPPS